MILESLLSCSYLLLTCGSCIYILIKHTYNEHSEFISHFKCACIGIALIGTRSLIVCLYKVFFKKYAFDPITIETEEARNGIEFNILDQILGTLGMASLTNSLYCHHGYCVLGACTAISVSIYDAVKLYYLKKAIQTSLPNDISPLTSNSVQLRCTIFIWLFLNAQFSYSVGNNFAFVANYPYLLTTWVFTPEGFYQGWTIRRTINDYMMTAYVIFMTEALRQK